MIHTQSEIDNLVELAIIQRAELKKLVDSLPQLRDHLSSEIERNLEEIEPAIRSELEQLVIARAQDAHAQSSAALTAKVDELGKALEVTTAARYSVLMAEREQNATLLERPRRESQKRLRLCRALLKASSPTNSRAFRVPARSINCAKNLPSRRD